MHARHSDGSGSIDRNEFLQIPQIANNPLASRMIAIFDEECVLFHLYAPHRHLFPPSSPAFPFSSFAYWLIVA